MKLCLIGSTRFMEQYMAANRELTLKGHIVYTVATISSESAMKPLTGSPISDSEKIVLDLVHLKKILDSDAVVLITDNTRYAGFSTRREIQWAQLLGKPCFWAWEDVPSIFYEGNFRGEDP